MDIKIPEERIGVLVGPGGSMKHYIEEKTKTTIEIDSETGSISVASAEDPLQALRVMDLVKAIGRGFSPVFLTIDGTRARRHRRVRQAT